MLIQWTFRALSHLESIYFYCKEQTQSEKVASKLYNDILDETDVLAIFPLIGKVEQMLENLSIPYRSLVIKRHYKIIYCISEDTVFIAAVWDCRMNPDSMANIL